MTTSFSNERGRLRKLIERLINFPPQDIDNVDPFAVRKFVSTLARYREEPLLTDRIPVFKRGADDLYINQLTPKLVYFHLGQLALRSRQSRALGRQRFTSAAPRSLRAQMRKNFAPHRIEIVFVRRLTRYDARIEQSSKVLC